MKSSTATSCFFYLILCCAFPNGLRAEDPVAWWDFEDTGGPVVRDRAGERDDAVEGRFKHLPGAVGSALRFDGFTTAIIREPGDAPVLGERFSMEAWVAPGAYPWNFCPIACQHDGDRAGYRFTVGPRGEVRLEVAAGGEWKVCTSKDWAVPLRRWTHVAGSFEPGKGLTLYVNGEAAGNTPAEGEPVFAPDREFRIGVNQQPTKPSHIHREHGTLPTWWSFDGFLDELKLYDRALSADEVKRSWRSAQPLAEPDMPLRRMPSGPEGPGRFGAYYTKLEYYEQWDALWRVGPDPDVLVRFDTSPVRVVFWRGTRYLPAWVSEQDLWMADQSVEAWGTGDADQEGCFEHMQDRHCRYSHVRIIESHDARVVVHWRYAPVSAHDHLWMVDEKTGKACWVDEYYTIYPDAMGIRKVTWQKGTLGPVRQFQESLPFTHPGQYSKDVVQKDFAFLANMKGETATLSFVEEPVKPKPGLPEDLNIQMYNFQSRQKPFIIYEPGTRMVYVHDMGIGGWHRPGACNHWPVGQAACDGRTSQAPDRPTHFLGFPISYPPVHEAEGRCWWNGIYGMTDRPVEDLVVVARSWNHPPELEVLTPDLTSQGYDRGQRAYLLTLEGGEPPAPIAFTLKAGDQSPLFNPAFVIRRFGPAGAKLKINGKEFFRGKGFRSGHRHTLEASHLVVWLELTAVKPVKLEIFPIP